MHDVSIALQLHNRLDNETNDTGQERGIRWNLFVNLNNLDFADDLVLLSHTHSHIQEKTNRLHIYAKQH